jgi:rubrerythrin
MADYKNPTEELSEWAGELLWKCTRCGYQWHRTEAKDLPPHCPSCGAPKTEFVLVAED